MLITVDTLSFAVHFDDENCLFDFLGVDQSLFEFSYAAQQNYSYSYYFQGIHLSFGGKSGKWTHYVHMSGKGCRTFEDLRGIHFDWFEFIKSVSGAGASFRRIDIAADDDSGLLTFSKVDRAFREGRVAGKARNLRCMYGSEECFYAGSVQSSSLIRIYNKALERGYSDGLVDGKPWTRCEMQLRDPAAGQFISEWIQSGDLKSIFCGHLLEQIRFTTKPNNKRNAQRLHTASWWSGFV